MFNIINKMYTLEVYVVQLALDGILIAFIANVTISVTQAPYND